MRFLPVAVLLALVCGCAQEDPYETRARGVATLLAQHVKGINKNLPPPEVDPPGPDEPDVAKALRESAKITKLQTEDLVLGSGRLAEVGKQVSIRFRGELPDGFVFDTNRKPNQPMLNFILGNHEVVEGFDLGIRGMRVGGRRRIIIPENLGYGANPREGSRIPKHCALIFTVDLLFVMTPHE